MQRLLFGAIAGVCATMAMTSGMRLLFGALGRKERYPLPPRETPSGAQSDNSKKRRE